MHSVPGDESEQPHEVAPQGAAVLLQRVQQEVHAGDLAKPASAGARRGHRLLLSPLSGEELQAAVAAAHAHEDPRPGLSVRVRQVRREVPAAGAPRPAPQDARRVQVQVRHLPEQLQSGVAAEEARAAPRGGALPLLPGGQLCRVLCGAPAPVQAPAHQPCPPRTAATQALQEDGLAAVIATAAGHDRPAVVPATHDGAA